MFSPASCQMHKIVSLCFAVCTILFDYIQLQVHKYFLFHLRHKLDTGIVDVLRSGEDLGGGLPGPRPTPSLKVLIIKIFEMLLAGVLIEQMVRVLMIMRMRVRLWQSQYVGHFAFPFSFFGILLRQFHFIFFFFYLGCS